MMTLKQELEILRGRPIELIRPVEQVPCRETSEPSLLPRHPVVSVVMTTYNHEKSIGRAIESALDQETDFEYEIVIGEDCSPDKTREICMAYQKRFPEKIRVLWSNVNVFKMGGSGPRVSHRCRGKFLAFLEGDDCWIDRHKLQKQVDAFRANPSVGICVGGGVIHVVETGVDFKWNGFLFQPGFMDGHSFLKQMLFESWRVKRGLTILTPTVMLRKSSFETAHKEFDIFAWNLVTRDTLCWAGTAAVSDAYYLQDEVGQYNVTPGSASFRPELNLDGDSSAVKVYFMRKVFDRTWRQVPVGFRRRLATEMIKQYSTLPARLQKDRCHELLGNAAIRSLRFQPFFMILFASLRLGAVSGWLAKFLLRTNGYLAKFQKKWRDLQV